MDQPTDKPTILVVEDEQGPRDALKVILRPFFTIHTAATGADATAILGSHTIDVVTLDQKLPDCLGIELLRDIKLGHPNVEVIIITGYGSLKSAMDGIRHGAAGYLLKPFNVTELIGLINQSLEKKRRLDSLREALRASGDPWSTEQEAAQLWRRLQDQYARMTPAPKESAESLEDSAHLIPMLSDLLEARDRQLHSHSSRVSFYATLFGNPMHLSPAQQRTLGLGAFLHDIGYVGLQDGLPPRDAEVKGNEAEALKRHTEVGARMVLPFGLPAEVGQIISYHHERFDGLGYPDGLQGEGIPLFARMVAIAQTFDNLTVGRAGQPAVSVDDAFQKLAAEAGKAFDPKLVKVFIQVAAECKASLPALSTTPNPLTFQDLKRDTDRQ